MVRNGAFHNDGLKEPGGYELLPAEPVPEPLLIPGVGLPPARDIIQLAEHAVYELYSAAKDSFTVELDKVLGAAQKICQNMQAIYVSPNISELSRISESVVYINLLEEPLRSSLTAHALKVSALSVYLGQQLHMSSTELHELACCGLANNIGLLTIPSSVLKKREPLTAEERLIVKGHPRWSRDFFARFGEQFQWLAQVAHQIHEREDGSGYPEGLNGKNIDIRAKIVGLADVYIALIQSRPQRPAFKPFDALNHIISSMEGKFDQSLLNIFIRALSVYPIGSYVELSSGETARVLVSNPSYPMRPIVGVVVDRWGHRLSSPQPLDLVENPMVYIQKPSSVYPQREQ